MSTCNTDNNSPCKNTYIVSFSREVIGFSTIFINKELNTSPILPGDDISSMPSVRVSVTGNNLLVNTAITEARMVLNMYRIITVLITPP